MRMKMSNVRPTRKVSAGLTAGSVVTVLIWVLGLANVEMPPDVSAALVTLLTFATSWLIPNRLLRDDKPDLLERLEDLEHPPEDSG